MRGSVYHQKRVCRLCREGDKNTINHPHHYIQLYLPYLPKKNNKLTGRERGKPFQDGVDAYIYLREIQPAIKEQEFIPWNFRSSEKSLCLFGNFFEQFKADKYSPTIKKHLAPLFGYDIKDINRIVVKQVYRKLPDDLKQSTRNLILQALHATLSEAYEEGIIEFVPAFPKRKKARKPSKNFITWNEQMAVIKAMPEHYQLTFLFLACHGKRLNEALSLRWEDIDFKRKGFKVFESKIEEENLLPMHDVFFDALPVAGVINKTGFVFPQFTHICFNRTLRIACEKAGVKKVTTHEFGRHSFSSQRLNNGYTREQVAMVTNNWSAMESYAHMNIEQKRKIINSTINLP